MMLERITELMFQNQRSWLFVDELFDDPDIGDQVRSLEIDSPYQILLKRNVLTEYMQDESLVVSYSFEAFFHYKLGQLIYEAIHHDPVNLLLSMCSQNDFDGFLESVTEALICCVAGSNADVIFDVIDSDLPLNIKVRPFSYYLIYNGAARGLSGLLENESAQDYYVLRKSINDLEYLRSTELCEELAVAYLEWPSRKSSFRDESGLWLLVECLRYCDEKTLHAYQDILLSAIEDLPSLEHDARQDLRLEMHSICANRGSFSLASSFLSIEQLFELAPEKLLQGYYGVIYQLLETSNFDSAIMIYEKNRQQFQGNGVFLSTSGWIFQVVFESGFGDISNLEKSLELYWDASELISREYGQYSFEYAKNLENIGWANFLNKDLESAKKYLFECLSVYKNLYGTEYNYISGNPCEMIASVCTASGEFASALNWLDHSDQCKLLGLDETNVEMAWNHMTRGECLEASGDLFGARKCFEIAARLRESLLGSKNHLTVESLESVERVSSKS